MIVAENGKLEASFYLKKKKKEGTNTNCHDKDNFKKENAIKPW